MPSLLVFIKKIFKSDALTGVPLLVALIVALVWANWLHQLGYERFWHLGIFDNQLFGVDLSPRFLVNDVLMTLFFYEVGMEIRKEMDCGALKTIKIAFLPIIAALGGVAMPAMIYTVFNRDSVNINGWAVPTATDIAFAIGLLTLFGKAVPNSIRAILLSLAIVDDIIAVIIIAIFYSHSGDYYGLIVVALAIIGLLYCQKKAFFRGYFYLLALTLVWLGLALSNIHPSLAGVVVGILIPANQYPAFFSAAIISRRKKKRVIYGDKISAACKTKSISQDHQSTPAVSKFDRVSLLMARALFNNLRPWVSYVIVPLFILANAGIDFSSLNFNDRESLSVTLGIICALVVGKPAGIFLASYVAVKLKLCHLPEAINWYSMLWIGLLAGIGFTMSLFIAMLAFDNTEILKTAKLAVQLGSALSATLAIIFGILYLRNEKRSS